MKRLMSAMLSLTLCGVMACASPRVLSVQEEQQAGQAVRGQVKQEFRLMRDRVVVTYIRQLGDELAKASRPSPFKPSFDVVEDPALNAFAIYGASIYITTGTILAADSVDELAGVMGHEIGHATARHAAKAFPVSQRTNFFARLLGFVISAATGRRVQRNAGAVLTNLAGAAYVYSHTREAEREADALAIETIYNAGYDPEGLTRFFEKIKKESAGRGVPRFLQSHPLPDERLTNINELIDERGPVPNPVQVDNEKFKLVQDRIRLILGELEPDAEPSED